MRDGKRGGKVFRFKSWSDGENVKHTITTSDSATTYTAKYKRPR